MTSTWNETIRLSHLLVPGIVILFGWSVARGTPDGRESEQLQETHHRSTVALRQKVALRSAELSLSRLVKALTLSQSPEQAEMVAQAAQAEIDKLIFYFAASPSIESLDPTPVLSGLEALISGARERATAALPLLPRRLAAIAPSPTARPLETLSASAIREKTSPDDAPRADGTATGPPAYSGYNPPAQTDAPERDGSTALRSSPVGEVSVSFVSPSPADALATSVSEEPKAATPLDDARVAEDVSPARTTFVAAPRVPLESVTLSPIPKSIRSKPALEARVPEGKGMRSLRERTRARRYGGASKQPIAGLSASPRVPSALPTPSGR